MIIIIIIILFRIWEKSEKIVKQGLQGLVMKVGNMSEIQVWWVSM